jgi:PAP2 superfamily
MRRWISPRKPDWRALACAWAPIAAVVAADVALSRALGFGWALGSEGVPRLFIVGALATLTVLAQVASLRRVAAISDGFGRMLAFFVAAGALQYLLAGLPAGSADAALAGFDKRLGFDWPALYAWFAAHPGLAPWLDGAYQALGWTMVFTVLFLGVIEPGKVAEFVSSLMIALALTVPVLALLPVAGPFVFYGHADLPQAWYTAHYLALRDGSLRVIDLADLRGIVSFPSFHAAGLVLTLYAVRRYPLVFWPMLVLDAGTLIAIPTEGGHYLVDIVGGFAVAAATLPLLRRFHPASATPAPEASEAPAVSSA